MDKLLGDFIDFLNKQNQVMDQLSQWGQDKKELIIQGQVKELDELIRRESKAINELQQLEEGRFRLQNQLADKWGLDITEISAREILKRVRQNQPAFFTDLEQAVNRLDFNLTRLRAINEHNNELLEDSLDYIGAIEASILGDKAGLYSSSGDQLDEKIINRKSLLDKKA
ncbi:hypothetical protein ASZ90_020286 [hydrocarbon metagenome]|uniref:FlgN protein n=1 Tax=hydrocarbon metagenome TaxID=938273 RepID=A0A0W8E1M6_9ZZZZ